MGRKKKEPEIIIPNEYAILWNAEFLTTNFFEHKKTKTKRIGYQQTKVTLEYLSGISSSAAKYNNDYSAFAQERIEEIKATSEIITFISPLAAKMWLISHSNLPGAREGSVFTFTEAEIDRIITKHKYDFRRGFVLDKAKSRPLLCEFEIVKLETAN